MAKEVRERSAWADWSGEEGDERGDIPITTRFVEEVDAVLTLATGNLTKGSAKKNGTA